jgi:hypothetical protein
MPSLCTQFASYDVGVRHFRASQRRHRHFRVQAAVEAPPKKDLRKPRAENEGLNGQGAFYVDHTCIGVSLSLNSSP